MFLTWRLYGSLPCRTEKVQQESGGKAFVAMDRELDRAATGPRWLQDERVAQCVVDALRYGERQLGLYQLRAWAVLVNHVHVLIHPQAKLSRITKAILGRTGQPFWQDESYDHWVRGPERLEKIIRYIEENPVTAGLVKRVDGWRWSSAFMSSDDRPDRPGGLSHFSDDSSASR